MAITTKITPLKTEILTATQYLQNAQNNAIAGVDASLAASQAGYKDQVSDINAQYDRIAREAYINYEKQKRASANSLASSGLYNSGYADTLRVSQGNQYAANQTSAELERAKSLRDLATEQESLRLQADADKANIYAQYGQLYANQANTDREYQASRDDAAWQKQQTLKEYEDARADVLWEREQYLKEAATQAEQTKLNNAYAAAEYGDFSQLAALGIDITAAKANYAAQQRAAQLDEAYAAAEYGDFSKLAALGIDTTSALAAYQQAQRAAQLDEAYAAADVGDFSLLEKLGIDTTDLKRLWAAQVYSSLNDAYEYVGSSGGYSSGGSSGSGADDDYGDLSNLEYMDAVARAEKLVNNKLAKGESWFDIINYVDSIQDRLKKDLGESWFNAYSDAIMSLFENAGSTSITTDNVFADLSRAKVNSRSDALDFISDYQGDNYATALGAVNQLFPQYNSLDEAKDALNKQIKNTPNPITSGKSFITQAQSTGQINAYIAAELKRWLDNEYDR